jgi:hypothetical protein
MSILEIYQNGDVLSVVEQAGEKFSKKTAVASIILRLM